ncbi:DUF6273 domain-containing protein [Olsenella sp. An290]|uniref:DUF6273 domain-containing protein n=1 Tax=Olsenella sp. An290 TaxID=1965625 RepID=UPI000B36A09A|nr:DUF6273 domain-containing protein [Olsenella sp. An290]OUO34494.1 hypothetical protein B5F84_06550 [Olsenella sp. An290]
MKCKNCDAELPENARFCPDCGTPTDGVPTSKKLEEPLEPMGLGAVPLVPIAPPPRASKVVPRIPRPYVPHSNQRPARYASSHHSPLIWLDEPERRRAERLEKAELLERRRRASRPAGDASRSEEEAPQDVTEAAERTTDEKDRAPEETVEVTAAEQELAAEEEPELAEGAVEDGVAPEGVALDDAAAEAAVDDGGEAESGTAEEAEAAEEPEPAVSQDPEADAEETDDEPEPDAKVTDATPVADAEDAEPSDQEPEPEPEAPENTSDPEPWGEDAWEEGDADVTSAFDRMPDDGVRRILGIRLDRFVAICVVALLAVVLIGGFIGWTATGWFGPLADRSEQAPAVQPPSDGSIPPLDQSEPAEEEAQPLEGGPEIKAALADYTWAELSQLSGLIAAAEDDAAALDIAKLYHLCTEEGTLDIQATKDLTLNDGTVVPITIAGFRHDQKADGSGVAGISFVARGSASSQPISASGQVTSWEDSTLRVWMNEGLMANLPTELADLVVPVTKLTNSPAGTGGAQQSTQESLWLLSYSEIVGELGQNSKRYAAYQSEGAQYQVFADAGVSWAAASPALILESGEYWWERSPEPTNNRWYMCVSANGEPSYGHRPGTADAIVMGFCL